MTMMRPCRRITLHFSHIFLTLGRTFTVALDLEWLFVTVSNATSGEVIRGEFHLHLVAGEYPDVVHPHLSGDVSQHFVAILQFHSEHRIRK
jgi:hypothetical protein